MDKEYTCVYCNQKFKGFGNNPDIWDGKEWKEDERCCDLCNDTVVIPGRIASRFMNSK